MCACLRLRWGGVASRSPAPHKYPTPLNLRTVSRGGPQNRERREQARCLAWWDIFDSTLDVAFTKEDPPQVSWDIEVALAKLQCRLISAHLGVSRRISAHLRRIFGSSSPQVALGGAGLPLPDCIEDSFLSWLTRLVMLGWLPDVETAVTAEQESCEKVMRSFSTAPTRCGRSTLDLEQEEADRCSDRTHVDTT